jgi:hypothetical protein
MPTQRLADTAEEMAKAFTILFNCGRGTPGARLFPARQFAAAAIALLLIAGVFFVSLFSVVDAEAKGPSGTCEDAAELAVLFSPTAP